MAVTSIRTEAVAVARPAVSMARLAGVMIAAMLPAMFWPLMLASLAQWTGHQVSSSALMALGLAIALFLTAVCAPLMLRRA